VATIWDRLAHIARHPYALIPGSPSGTIECARTWSAGWARTRPADIRRGPAAIAFDVVGAAMHELPAPTIIGGEHRAARLFARQPSTLYYLRGARIVGAAGTVISPDNKVFSEFTYVDDPGGIASHSVFRRRRWTRPAVLKGRVATLCYPSSRAYGHWIIESLPRLRLLEPWLDSLDAVLVPSQAPAAVYESVRRMGVRQEQLVEIDEGTHLQPEVLLVPAYCAGLDVPPWAVAYLRERLCPAGAPASRPIYVSRARTGRRRVVNEDELARVLQAHRFEIIHPQELSFADQVRTFNEAEVVIGAFGSALVNVVFSQPGTTLIELVPFADSAGHLHYALAAGGGVRYTALVGTPAPAVHGMPRRDSDFTVDPQLLERVLTTLG
jgi:capsular polysaccharide biosynthesis protein